MGFLCVGDKAVSGLANPPADVTSVSRMVRQVFALYVVVEIR